MTSPDLPQAAIDAAAAAITRSLAEDHPDTWMESDELLARAALAAAAPHLAAADRDLLAEADKALWACAKAFLTVEPTLKVPYPEVPGLSPWSRWCERPARAAHDLHVRIRRHLKTPITPEGDSHGTD